MATEGLQFTTTHGVLSGALAVFDGLMEKRANFPIMAGVVLEQDNDGGVFLRGMDYEVSAEVRIATWNAGHVGRLLVNRAQLTDYVKSMLVGTTKTKAAPMLVEIDDPCEHDDSGSDIGMSIGGYEFTLPKMKLEDYPESPKRPTAPDSVVKTDRDALLVAVERLAGFVGRDDTLPMLTGINFKSVSDGLELAATDRFRLGIDFLEADVSGDVSAIVPAKVLHKMLKLIPSGPVLIEFCQNLVFFTVGDVTASLRLIDRGYPKYARLLPDDSHALVELNRQDLAVAVKRVSVATTRGRAVKFEFTPGGVIVKAGDEDGRAVSPLIPAERAGSEDPIERLVNPVYLGDVLAAFKSERLTVALQQKSGSPLLVSEPGNSHDNRAFRVLIMPATIPG